MASIRVKEWTKRKLEEIADEEDHSSHDSVIKSLLKDRKLAQFVGIAPEAGSPVEPDIAEDSVDKAVDGLSVLAEMGPPENGVLFVWCPNCENEIAHLTVDGMVSIDVFEVDCQRCLTKLDQHVLVAIELSYPLEERLVEGGFDDDLKACVIDYWNRALSRATSNIRDSDADVERLPWRIDRYLCEFGWDWPSDIPVATLEPGRSYVNERDGEIIEVLERASQNRTELDSFRVRRYASAEKSADSDPEMLDSSAVTQLVLNRNLTLKET